MRDILILCVCALAAAATVRYIRSDQQQPAGRPQLTLDQLIQAESEHYEGLADKAQKRLGEEEVKAFGE